MLKEKLNKHIFLIIIIIFLLYIFLFFNENKKSKILSETIPSNNYSDQVFLTSPKMLSNRVSLSDNSEKIINTHLLSIEVKNANQIKNQIQDKINNDDKIYIENFNSYTYSNNQLAYDWTFKILSSEINNYIKFFKSLGIIKSENSSSVNVTEIYNDNENRLKNLYTRRNNLRILMDKNNSKLADILSIDKELSKVQLEIENYENNNKKINDNVEYSKLNLSIIPEIEINNIGNNKWNIKKSFKISINKLILFTQLIIDLIFTTIFFIPYLLIFYFIYKILIKKNNPKM